MYIRWLSDLISGNIYQFGSTPVSVLKDSKTTWLSWLGLGLSSEKWTVVYVIKSWVEMEKTKGTIVLEWPWQIVLKNMGLLFPIQQQGSLLNKWMGIHCDKDFDDHKGGGGPATVSISSYDCCWEQYLQRMWHVFVFQVVTI